MDTDHASPDKAVADAVAAALKDAGIPQRDAADRTGIAFTTLRRRLTGNSSFTVSELAQLAVLLNIPVSHLISTRTRGAA